MTQLQNGYKGSINHDSFFGWINMFKRIDQRFFYKQSERTPYPIIIDRPLLRQSLSNFNRADFGITLTASFLGFFLARASTKTCSTEYLRQRLFNATWTSLSFFGFMMGLQNSTMRLQGFTDNGLQWKRSNNSLKKYDFTKDYEQGSIWKYFRLRD